MLTAAQTNRLRCGVVTGLVRCIVEHVYQLMIVFTAQNSSRFCDESIFFPIIAYIREDDLIVARVAVSNKPLDCNNIIKDEIEATRLLQ